MDLHFSIIIPIYNRPEELDELLNSIINQLFDNKFEVVVIEDGSDITSKHIVEKYADKLNIKYLTKENSGPGLSRNFGMQQASGNYFIILDSDCILPKNYLTVVFETLSNSFADAYGGSDAAHQNFTVIQKAINYAMTSVFTTGGIRGNKNLRKFQPRSFNMGVSKSAFEQTKGFSKMRFGEDINLTFRLWKNNFETQFIEEAYVFHKRRISWPRFFNQTFNFGAARPILNKLHPNTAKLTYWFPSVFIIGLLISLIGMLIFLNLFFTTIVFFFDLYLLIIFMDSLLKNKSITVAVLSIVSTLVMFFGYGIGFLRSMFRLVILSKPTEEAFPEMFK